MKQWLVDTNVILVINPVIFAEVSACIESLEELDNLLPEELFRRDHLPWEAIFLAGRAFAGYKKGGGQKKRMLADFLIGAHAAVHEFGLITRDSGIAKYFAIHVRNPGREG